MKRKANRSSFQRKLDQADLWTWDRKVRSSDRLFCAWVERLWAAHVRAVDLGRSEYRPGDYLPGPVPVGWPVPAFLSRSGIPPAGR